MKNLLILEINFLLSLILLPAVLGAGVSYDPSILEMAPGEIKEIPINLQNMIGDDAVTFILVWDEGKDIADAPKETYTLKPQSEETFIIKVSIPQDAKPGDIYKLKLRVNTAPTGGQKIEVTTGSIIERQIKVISKKIESPEPQSSKSLYAVIGIILVAILVLLIILKRKKR